MFTKQIKNVSSTRQIMISSALGQLNLRKEWFRLSTFKRWDGDVSVIGLSRNGLYFTQIEQNVKCYKCSKKTSLSGVTGLSVDPAIVHEEGCPWISEWDSDNEPIHGMFVAPMQMVQRGNIFANGVESGTLACCPDERCTVHRGCQKLCAKPNNQKTSIKKEDYIGILRDREAADAEYTGFESIERRRRSFQHSTKPSELLDQYAEAGFFDKGDAGIVYCFQCGLGMRTDTLDCDPWIEHARWIPTCPHVVSNKGKSFIHCCLEITVTEIMTNERM